MFCCGSPNIQPRRPKLPEAITKTHVFMFGELHIFFKTSRIFGFSPYFSADCKANRAGRWLRDLSLGKRKIDEEIGRSASPAARCTASCARCCLSCECCAASRAASAMVVFEDSPTCSLPQMLENGVELLAKHLRRWLQSMCLYRVADSQACRAQKPSKKTGREGGPKARVKWQAH